MLSDFRTRGGRERGRETSNINVREKHQSVACHRYPTGDQTHNLGICSDQELNLGPLDLWGNAPTN